MELVILSAGQGQRFGGLKQFEPIDNNNNFIMDYTIFDAIRIGIKKIIVVINPEYENIFNQTIKKRWQNKVNIQVAFQYKRLGTCDALIQAKDFIEDDFVVVNADDFYGQKPFLIAKNFLNSNQKENALVAYKLKNTISNNKVKRGICKASQQGFLQNIKECLIEKNKFSFTAKSLGNDLIVRVKPNDLVSVNFFVLRKNIFSLLQNEYEDFKNQSQTQEFFLPLAITNLINKNLIQVRVFKTNQKLIGLTYRQDKNSVEKIIKNLIITKKYPKNITKSI